MSARASEDISEEERRYEDGRSPEVLDVIYVPMLEPKANRHQSENHLIDDKYYWEKVGSANWADVEGALDTVSGPLWINRHSTWNGLNDQVPEAEVDSLTSSLYLIRPTNLRISVGVEGGVYGPVKRKVRASFSLNQSSYTLMVTDPVIERTYLAGQNGSFPIKKAILCVSLGEVFYEYAYKLVATVITPDLGD
ncbi:MAG: hypothetical protein IH897_09085 [Planctomycetes bacterium]|nr:hypothetical protein [Planctomycetota bacterium]